MKGHRRSPLGRSACFLRLSWAVLFACTAQVCWAATIYQENFGGSVATNLAGLTPNIAPGSETWGGATEFKANGFVNSNFAGIWLPFTPSPGFVYTLTGSFQVASGDWLGIGFAGGSPTSVNRFADNDGRGWLIAKSNQIQAFVGPKTSGQTSQSTISPQSPSGVVTTQTITLDASNPNPASWTFSATQTIGSTNYTVWTNRAANVTSAGDITAIGLSSSGASGTFTSFTLTAVPEPATITLAFGGLAAVAAIAIRRSGRS